MSRDIESGQKEWRIPVCWLSPLELNNGHYWMPPNNFRGVGKWLLETTEFQEGRNSEERADSDKLSGLALGILMWGKYASVLGKHI